MRLSQPFAIKFISTLFKPMSKGIIPTIYYHITDNRFRQATDVRKWLTKQEDICEESKLFTKFYEKCIDSIATKHFSNTDDLIVEILKYVKKNIRYQTDSNNFGWTEYWEDLPETVKRGKGDCENQNALIYTIARMAGVPSFLLWNCIGTSNEGHYWLLYFSPKKAQFYAIDTAFRPNLSQLRYRQPFKVGSQGYKKLYYVFNHNHTFKSR